MSLLKKLSVQGNKLVVREAGTNKVLEVHHPPRGQKLDNKKTWRAVLREMTNNGQDMHQILLNLANGVPIVRNHNGMETEPILPTPEVMLQASKALHEMLHGKSVAETEIVKAEEETEKMRQFSAYSLEDLERMYFEAKARRESTDAELVSGTDAGDGVDSGGRVRELSASRVDEGDVAGGEDQ